MSLHYLVKCLCSNNRYAQEVIEANCHVRLSHSKKQKDVHTSHIDNTILDCTELL